MGSASSNGITFVRQPALRRGPSGTARPLPGVEPLEGRRLLTTFVVTNLNDSGAGSLRQAILDANAGTGTDTIAFSISAGTRTITPNRTGTTTTNLGPLPDVTDPVIIDGTAPAAFPTQVIELSGQFAPAGANGLKVTAGGSTVRGLTINRFAANGIELAAGGGNVVEGCNVGVDATGTIDLGNGDDGIDLNASSNNRIGGTAAAQRNVISGNNSDGIDVGAGSSGNQLLGNYIGLNAAGTGAVGNTALGVRITGAAGNTIGGASAARIGNVISGNAGGGVRISGAGATGNGVLGNYIGTNAAGTAAVANGTATTAANGVSIVAASNNAVGGTAAGAGNVISGNTGNGVEVAGTGGATTGNLVQGNFIGTTAAGAAALGNGNDGVAIDGAAGNTVGGAAANRAARNVIAANGDDGVELRGATAAGNVVQGNYVGLAADGSAPLGNGSDGVEIEGAANNTVGGTSADAANVISANASDGIELWAGTGGATGVPTGNVIQGNAIGLTADGAAVRGNGKDGVNIAAATNTTIGGTAAGAANRIAGSGAAAGGAGVRVEAGTGNAVRGNAIYSTAAGASGSGLGIDLAPGGAAGVTSNDAGDADVGPNNLQNFPVLTSARTDGANTTVRGTVAGPAGSSFAVDLFATVAGVAPDPTGYGEGARYLGTVSVTTDAAGNAAFAVLLPTGTAGQSVSATATDAAGNTSEFALNLAVATVSDAVPPTGTGTFAFRASPHRLAFTFSEDVGASVQLGDVTVRNVGTGATVAATGVSYAGNVATFSFAGILPDGNYRATVAAGNVTDATGNPLLADVVVDFFALAGDANRDRAVDVADLGILATHYGKTSDVDFATGDFNGDGAVDVADLGILATNYGKSLAPPSSPMLFTAAASTLRLTSATAAPSASAAEAEPRVTIVDTPKVTNAPAQPAPSTVGTVLATPAAPTVGSAPPAASLPTPPRPGNSGSAKPRPAVPPAPRRPVTGKAPLSSPAAGPAGGRTAGPPSPSRAVVAAPDSQTTRDARRRVSDQPSTRLPIRGNPRRVAPGPDAARSPRPGAK